jgi:WD40 repeat protein/SAM-dependent methyltransferase
MIPKGMNQVKDDGSPYKLIWSYSSKGAIISVAATSNCSLIAVASVDKTISLLNGYGKRLWRKELESEVWAVDISKAGNYIAAGTANKNPSGGYIYIYDIEGNRVWSHKIGSPVWGVSLSEDGSVLAVTSWNNKAYRFLKTENGYTLDKSKMLGKYGLYGVSLSNDGSICAIAAYDKGVIILDSSWSVIKNFKAKANTGLYKLQLSEEKKSVVVGCREGCYLLIPNIKKPQLTLSTQFSQRPVCGVSISSDTRIITLGSFDGSAYLTSKKGRCFWKFETSGEIWGTAMSSDGSLICIGSGDGNVYLLENMCSSAVIKEIEAFEEQLEKLSGKELKKGLENIIDIYVRYGLVEYGINRIKEISSPKLLDNLANDKIIISLIEKYIKRNPTNHKLHFELANYYNRIETLPAAIKHYQIASQDPNLSYYALNLEGEIFLKLKFESAAMSCFRRAIRQSLNNDGKNILYDLARSYEDYELWEAAAILYEILISWDANFRNSWDRLDNIKNKKQKQTFIDYTGVTVNLLGVDAPKEKNVDKKLSYIIESRAKELAIDIEERSVLSTIIESICEKIDLSITDKRNKSLDYDKIAYLKYDYLPAEDEIKKQIEMIYELSILQKNSSIKTSLDIGAATGRHPTILAKQGISALGIDIEPEAMFYAKKVKDRTIPEAIYPVFLIGSANNLPFCDNCFDLITCMMGTFAHFPPDDREDILKEIKRILRPEGLLLVSTWDIECDHLSYLSIYEQSEKDIIKNNSFPLHEMKVFLEHQGFIVSDTIQFILLPNVITYELNIEKLTVEDIKRTIAIDLSARSLYPDMHGEMYMVGSNKPKSFE